jgi:MFS family permease
MGSLCIIVGAVLQASSFHVAQLLVGRIIAGIGLGVRILALLTLPYNFSCFGGTLRTDCERVTDGLKLIVANIIVWESELSPSHIRGRLVASALTFLILGDVR